MPKAHTHPRSSELFVYWIPADPDTPMELKLIPNTLQAMQNFVGGYIEARRHGGMPFLPCGCEMTMVMNEEGRLKNLAINRRASLLYPNEGRGVVGEVFMVGQGRVEPDKTSHSYEPGDGPMIDLFTLPTNFHTWGGPGTPIPTGVQAWEG